jgi:hypothetical protein
VKEDIVQGHAETEGEEKVKGQEKSCDHQRETDPPMVRQLEEGMKETVIRKEHLVSPELPPEPGWNDSHQGEEKEKELVRVQERIRLPP